MNSKLGKKAKLIIFSLPMTILHRKNFQKLTDYGISTEFEMNSRELYIRSRVMSEILAETFRELMQEYIKLAAGIDKLLLRK